VSHFQRALDIDSTFALAAYRLGVAAQSVGSGLEDGLAYGRLRIAQALRHSGNLPLRDQQRIRAGYAVVHGDLSEAMATLDSIIAHHPDDVATLGHIAVLQSAMNPAYGRSFTEARKSVEQMSRLGASMLPLLRDIEYYEGNLERAESLSRRELSLAPWNRQARVSHAVMFGDGLSVDSAAAMAGGLGPEVVSAMLRNWSVRGVPPDRLERFVSSLNESATSRIYDRWLARFALQRGRWREARARLAPMRGAEDVLFFARVSALPHVPVTSTWLDSLTRAVQALPVDPDVVIDTDAGTPSPGVRAYMLGLLAVRRGDFEEAARRSAELDGLRSVGPPEARELVVDLAAGVRARMRWAQGDPAGALASLEAAPMRPWWGPTHGIRFRVHERFLRAELLHELGRYAEALPWFETLPQGTADGLLHDATAHLRMAQIHERLGHADRAISHYGAFIDLWADCDPELRPQVDAARARRQALMAGAG
jgi:tetratricopeptide (TPR) repeat protein